MPGPVDAKAIIDAAAAAVAEGCSEVGARCRAIAKCALAGGLSVKQLRAFAAGEQKFLNGSQVLRARDLELETELIRSQDIILQEMLDEDEGTQE